VILADQTASATCPPGCAGHLPNDDGTLHISVEQVVKTSGHGDQGRIYVSREVEARRGAAPVVRIQGATDRPMTPGEALQLAAALVAEAIASMTSWSVAR
jgi:hypothetical protein